MRYFIQLCIPFYSLLRLHSTSWTFRVHDGENFSNLNPLGSESKSRRIHILVVLPFKKESKIEAGKLPPSSHGHHHDGARDSSLLTGIRRLLYTDAALHPVYHLPRLSSGGPSVRVRLDDQLLSPYLVQSGLATTVFPRQSLTTVSRAAHRLLSRERVSTHFSNPTK